MNPRTADGTWRTAHKPKGGLNETYLKSLKTPDWGVDEGGGDDDECV